MKLSQGLIDMREGKTISRLDDALKRIFYRFVGIKLQFGEWDSHRGKIEWWMAGYDLRPPTLEDLSATNWEVWRE